MASIRKTHLLAAVLCLLFGWTSGRAFPEKLSSGQKAPHFANSSAGRSLALPRSEDPSTPPESGDEASGLEQFLARLRLKASGQTPADTSLLPRKDQQSRRSGQQNLLELLHIKASGQTPADTSLLPRRRAEPESTKSRNGAATFGQESGGSQSRRAGSAAHVTIVNAQNSAGVNTNSLTPANVGLLGKPGGKPPPSPAAAPQEEGVQREETSSFKEVNGESVRVVVGNYGYESPEGLPVSFKYMSDENGNQASFTIGAGGSGGAGGSRPGGAGGGSKGGAGGAGGKGKGTGAGAGKGGGGGGAKGGSGGAKGGAGGGKGGSEYLPPK